jgi:hypothetical protein
MKSFLEENNLIEPIEMTLRDYFAAQALPLVTKTYTKSWIQDGSFDGYSDIEMICIAEGSYEMADAMMKARNDS